MDPLSITTAASSPVFQIVKNGKALADIYGKYKGAQRCVFMMQTECTVLAAALSRVEIVFHARTESTIQDYPASLIEALDLSLVGCTLTLSILSKEIGNLTRGASGEDVAVKKTKKARYVWNKSSMNDLLLQLRGQSSALALLLEALNTSSIGRILAILESGQPTFRKVAEDAASIRAANPKERYAESICDLPLSIKTDDDSRSIYTLIGRDTSQTSSQALTDRRRFPAADRRAPQDNLARQASSAAEAEFIRSLDALRESMKAPALAVGILSTEGSSVYIRGVRKHDCPTPVTRMDRFVVGAMGEVMLRTVLAVLIERGVFCWSTTIAEAMSDSAKSIHADHHGTTLEMLCAHVSGIETTMDELFNDKDWTALRRSSGIEGRSTIAIGALTEGPQTSPGRKYYYSELNMFILTSIIEKRTSRSIEDLLKAELFDPLEMYHTGQYSDPGGGSGNTPTQPLPHQYSEDGDKLEASVSWKKKCPVAYWPLFCISSSVPDLMILANLYLRGAVEATTPLLNVASFEKLLTPLHGTDSMPGDWYETQSGFRKFSKINGWSCGITINRQKKEAYTFLANVAEYFFSRYKATGSRLMRSFSIKAHDKLLSFSNFSRTAYSLHATRCPGRAASQPPPSPGVRLWCAGYPDEKSPTPNAGPDSYRMRYPRPLSRPPAARKRHERAESQPGTDIRFVPSQ